MTKKSLQAVEAITEQLEVEKRLLMKKQKEKRLFDEFSRYRNS